jgi:hypothetical protein
LLEVKLKVAVVVPPKLVVEMTVPLSTSDTDVIPVAEVFVSLKVKLLKVTILVPGFVNRICCIVTPEAPGIWVELEGGFEPCEACTITSVGVPVNVMVEVTVAVAVGVVVLVAVFVKVLVDVDVAVWVAVLVDTPFVTVGVKVWVGVFVAVLVTVEVAGQQ